MCKRRGYGGANGAAHRAGRSGPLGRRGDQVVKDGWRPVFRVRVIALGLELGLGPELRLGLVKGQGHKVRVRGSVEVTDKDLRTSSDLTLT